MANRFDQAPQIGFRQRPSTYVPQEFVGIPLEYIAGSLQKRQKEFDTATLKNEAQKSLFKPSGLRQVTAYGQSLAVNDYNISQIRNEIYAQKSNEINDRLAKGDYTAIKEIHKLGQQYQRDPYLKAIAEREKYYNDVIAPSEKKQYKTEAEYYDLEKKKFEFANSKNLNPWGTPQIYDYYDTRGEADKMAAGTEFDQKIRQSLGASLTYITDNTGKQMPVLAQGSKEDAYRSGKKIADVYWNGLQGNEAMQEAIRREALAEVTKGLNLGQEIIVATPTEKDPNKKSLIKVTEDNFNAIVNQKMLEKQVDLLYHVVNKYTTKIEGLDINYSQLAKDYLGGFGFGEDVVNPKAAGTETLIGSKDLSTPIPWYRSKNEKNEITAEKVSAAYGDLTDEKNQRLVNSYINLLKQNPKAQKGYEEYKKWYKNATFEDYAKDLADDTAGTWGGDILSIFAQGFGDESSNTKSFTKDDVNEIFNQLQTKGITQNYEYRINSTNGVENANLLSMNTAKQFIGLEDNKETKASDYRIAASLADKDVTIRYSPKNDEGKEVVVSGENAIILGKDLVSDFKYIMPETQSEHAHQIGIITATNSTSTTSGYSLSEILLNPNLMSSSSETFSNPISNSSFVVRKTTKNGKPALAISQGGEDKVVVDIKNFDPTLYTNESEIVSRKDITDIGTFTVMQSNQNNIKK